MTNTDHKNIYSRVFLECQLWLAKAVRWIEPKVKNKFFALFFMLALYGVLTLTSNSPPLKFGEFLIWSDQLSPRYKTTLIGSLVTISGFVLAFHIASENWKVQALNELKTRALKEIQLTTSIFINCYPVIDTHAEKMIRLHEYLSEGHGPTVKLSTLIDTAEGTGKDCLEASKTLTDSYLQFQRLRIEHTDLMMSKKGMLKCLDDYVESLCKVAKSTIFFHFPKHYRSAVADIDGDFLGTLKEWQNVKTVIEQLSVSMTQPLAKLKRFCLSDIFSYTSSFDNVKDAQAKLDAFVAEKSRLHGAGL